MLYMSKYKSKLLLSVSKLKFETNMIHMASAVANTTTAMTEASGIHSVQTSLSSGLEVLHSILGIAILVGIAWFMGKRSVKLHKLIFSVVLQIIFTGIIIKSSYIYSVFVVIGRSLMKIQEAALAGTSFVFGYLAGGNVPFELSDSSNLFIFAIHALPPIIVFSAISMVLFHWGIIQKISWLMGRLFKKTFNIGGALGLFSTTKIFLGQTDAPIIVKDYIGKMSKGEIFTIMTTGMATSSFAIVGLYSSILSNVLVDPTSHVVIASIINITLSIIISKAVMPHSHQTSVVSDAKSSFSSTMEAIFSGTNIGTSIVTSIISMIIVFLAIITLLNMMLSVFGISIETILGYIFFPIAYILGLNANEALIGGSIIGMKISLNEVPAMIQLSKSAALLSEKARHIISHSIINFGNISSMGIQIGGLSALCPERKGDIISMAPKALIVSVLVNCLSACIVGMMMILNW